ncbi:hypothetical protein KUCAC02_016619 [Chaenocephalus aceratus]|nr:hypothetical protein KUCAC02_016619 [Chaenocephalus aceratus]
MFVSNYIVTAAPQRLHSGLDEGEEVKSICTAVVSSLTSLYSDQEAQGWSSVPYILQSHIPAPLAGANREPLASWSCSGLAWVYSHQPGASGLMVLFRVSLGLLSSARSLWPHGPVQGKPGFALISQEPLASWSCSGLAWVCSHQPGASASWSCSG